MFIILRRVTIQEDSAITRARVYKLKISARSFVSAVANVKTASQGAGAKLNVIQNSAPVI